jgi:hypothetical protein
MKNLIATIPFLAGVAVLLPGCEKHDAEGVDCAKSALGGVRPIADVRDQRFLGKIEATVAGCRGGDKAIEGRAQPWVDWPNYWAVGDASSRAGTTQDQRGVVGAITDLEYQRVELLKFNLFDSSGTYVDYVQGRGGSSGATLKVWPQMRLAPTHPSYRDVGGGGAQLCGGELIRYRTLTGICNDLRNPAMGSAGEPFSRMVEFESTFPDLGQNALARNRHDARLGLLRPDPQVISRVLLTRAQREPKRCHAGMGLPGGSKDAKCDYAPADTLNVLAAFWIQFMTHDWFSHLDEGHNGAGLRATGCIAMDTNAKAEGLTADEISHLGCRPDDRIDPAYVAEESALADFDHAGQRHLTRAYKTTNNMVTAWWDASQIYGYDERSRSRVKRDPHDRARLLLIPTAADPIGYLPVLAETDAMNPAWAGQEATAFADNWNVGLSFFHNVFAREHNAFVAVFRAQASHTPDDDCGLRGPADPDRVVRYRDVDDDMLFEVARLVIAAEIAKIHTIEWTTQLLYDEPLYRAMNANWSGLIDSNPELTQILRQVVGRFGRSSDIAGANQWYSVFASGPGIIGLGSKVYADGIWLGGLDPGKRDLWDLRNPDHVNGGTNHFGAPFNFPEEFVTVYRLHSLMPDLIDFRVLADGPNAIGKRIPVVSTFRGGATAAMRFGGLANWALSLGRQRAGALALRNYPQFLQHLPMPQSRTATGLLDVAALDILRDRERGVPRFNEFRRQLGLRQLTGFDDFIDTRLPAEAPERTAQQSLARDLRSIYGQHTCDRSKPITTSQRNTDDGPIDDCLGHADHSVVDNIEDLDTVVGWLAESTRPHGFAISETQFQVFILNASRRLFSDRFFTSSYRPEFYSTLGMRWVEDNGPDGKMQEAGAPNGHSQEVSPLKRVLLRAIPTLSAELASVINVFDPWARERGAYYTLAWKPRPGAQDDEAFARRQ